ncbi:MAG: hypothetical protein UU93_C0005G0024 [Candidatus Amesbacteria bacterium GW2011_GWA2_42_12]|uniref:Uncharacterized protein n=1 Tax=Candidatus Amesbacteria bacterium GW2011_GWA2_42_12 TaxID=1618356 RepID=A0A0G1AF14_9BACT|nr:MAG: hypothetical protein UU93_C0005G0024 [Candidatus Amesbacteria bacterium GW2011_GWA2_42_12]
MFKPALVFIASSLVLAGSAYAVTSSLTISSPIKGQVVTSDTVTVNLTTPGFKLVDYRTNTKPAYATGHIHLWLDQQSLTKVSAIKIITPTYTFQNIKPGNHILVAELVANDHSSLNPKIIAVTNFVTMLPKPVSNSSDIVMISVMAFLLIVIALYFISAPKTYKSPRKSSPKSPKKSSRK